MFEQLTQDEKRTVFKALKTLIESPLGVHEFYNGDKSHPFLSLEGGMYHGEDVQAAPENTPIFRMLSELSDALKSRNDTEYVWWYDFATWRSFCEFCRECHKHDVANTGVTMGESQETR